MPWLELLGRERARVSATKAVNSKLGAERHKEQPPSYLTNKDKTPHRLLRIGIDN